MSDASGSCLSSARAPGEVDPPGGNFRWVICGLLFFSVWVNYVDRLVLSVLKVPLSQQLGWSEMDYGHIAAAFSFAYAFGYLFGGRLMDRWGVKRGLPIFVFELAEGNIRRVAAGERVGTIISTPEEG